MAYTKAEDYANAVKTYDDAIKLNPDFADSYYSRAVCKENLAKDIVSGEVVVNADGSLEKAQENSDDEETSKVDKKLDDNAKSVLANLLKSAIDDYNLYLEKVPTADDRAEIEANIKELEEMSEKDVK